MFIHLNFKSVSKQGKQNETKAKEEIQLVIKPNFFEGMREKGECSDLEKERGI